MLSSTVGQRSASLDSMNSPLPVFGSKRKLLAMPVRSGNWPVMIAAWFTFVTVGRTVSTSANELC
jgi:hypothetical protein